MVLLGIFYLCFLILSSVSVLCCWGLLVMLTLLGLYYLYFNSSSESSMVQYFILQELAGLIFLVNLSNMLQILALVFKGGFSPFHWWIVYVVQGSSGNAAAFILTVAKAPYYILLPFLLSWSTALVFVFFVFPLLIHSFVTYNNIVLFNILTASGSILVVFSYLNSNLSFLFIALYTLFVFFQMSWQGFFAKVTVDYSIIAVMVSFPLTITMMIKYWFFVSLGSGTLGLLFMLLCFLFLTGSLGLLVNLVFMDYRSGLYPWSTSLVVLFMGVLLL